MNSTATPPFAAVVLAAGASRRMRSARSKVLHELLGVPLVAWPTRAALAAGARRVVVVTGPDDDAVADAARAHVAAPDRVSRAVQPQPRGTADAVWHGLGEVGDAEVVVLLCGDAPGVSPELVGEVAREGAACGLALVSVELDDPTGYGRVVRDGTGRVVAIVEDADATPAQRALREVNAGLYAVRTALLTEWLRRVGADNAQGERYLTDIVALAVRDGVEVRAVAAGDPALVAGINDRTALEEVEAALSLRHCRRWQTEVGVTFHLAHTSLVGPDVTFERDAEVGPGVTLLGRTRVGAGARIDRGAVLHDVNVGAGAHVKPYTVATDSIVGPGAQVGPFAHLRPGSVLDARVKVGNFVETKKAHLHEGAKASHLTYLGDAEVGAAANIGAGTITCNYDGTHKHRTVIGPGAFIGSDTQLVAPVEVGEGAYVGAGTTVTRDVPPGALAISRAPQRNIEGWVARRRQRSRGDERGDA